MNRKVLFSLLLLASFVNLKAQEMMGITGSNYAGTNGLILNPASGINSRLYMDINLVTADAFFENNYLYIPSDEYSFGNLFKKQFQTNTVNNQGTLTSDKLTINDRYNNDPKNLYQQLRLTGPSFFLNYQRHAFGIGVAARSVISAHNIPFDVAKFGFEGLTYAPQHNIRYNDKNFKLTELSWAELNLSYAYMLIKKDFEQLSVGITVHKLWGYAGFSLLGNKLEYTMLSDSVARIHEFDAEVGYSGPMDYSNFSYNKGSNTFRGHGWGFDIGFVYQKNANSSKKGRGEGAIPSLCGQKFTEYDYKIGISLLDVGAIKFTQDAYVYAFGGDSVFWPRINKTNYKGLDTAIQDLNYRFHGDSAFKAKSRELQIFLPTALSLQFDYHIYDRFFVNSVLFYGITIGKVSVWRPAQLAIVPRYESRFFELNLPVSLYNLSNMRLGASLRLLWLTIGTDKLGPFIGGSDFTGMDFYFSIKINFNKGYCKKAAKTSGCPNGEYKRYLK